MEGSTAECDETGPVSGRTFRRLAGRPFPFAVTVTHPEGEELMAGRNRHIAFADDPLCVFKTDLSSRADLIPQASGLAAAGHGVSRWPGGWSGEGHGHRRVTEGTERDLGTGGWRLAFKVFCRDFGELFLVVARRRVVFVLLAVWVSSTFRSGALRNTSRILGG